MHQVLPYLIAAGIGGGAVIVWNAFWRWALKDI